MNFLSRIFFRCELIAIDIMYSYPLFFAMHKALRLVTDKRTARMPLTPSLESLEDAKTHTRDTVGTRLTDLDAPDAPDAMQCNAMQCNAMQCNACSFHARGLDGSHRYRDDAIFILHSSTRGELRGQ